MQAFWNNYNKFILNERIHLLNKVSVNSLKVYNQESFFRVSYYLNNFFGELFVYYVN